MQTVAPPVGATLVVALCTGNAPNGGRQQGAPLQQNREEDS